MEAVGGIRRRGRGATAMRGGRVGSGRGDVSLLFDGASAVALGDGELLARFLARRDEAAFEALVARLGPTVLGACRRMLADPHDIDDAFQATFLVLVRRGGTIRDRDRVATWTYEVAVRVARRARLDAARRLARERRAASSESGEVDSSIDRTELRAQIDEEIARLPEHHRRAVLLCDVEGLSREEAAARLGWTPNMVRGRLDRARARLRERLSRRGLAPSDAWMTLIGPPLAPKPLLVALTARTALSYATGRSLIQGPAVALCEGVIRMMMLARWKLAATALLSACAVAGTSGIFAGQGPGGGSGPDPAQVPAVASKPLLPAPGAKANPDDPTARSEEVLRSSAAIGKARVEAARVRLEAQQAFYDEGRITIDRLIDASRMMMEAELAIAGSPEAREAPLRAHVVRLRLIKAREQAELVDGRATTADVAEAESRLLDAEFLLARELEARDRAKGSGTPSSPRPGAIARLGKDWVAAARSHFDRLKASFATGQFGVDGPLAASRILLEAEREAAGSKQARDDAVGRHVARLQEIRKQAGVIPGPQEGINTPADMAKIEASLADAESLLAKQTEGPGPIPKPDAPPAADPLAAPKADARPKSSRDLAQERVKLARMIKDNYETLARAGETKLIGLMTASKALLEAELDAADSKAARLDILAALIRDGQEFEEAAAILAARGDTNGITVSEAQAAVLEARYRLAKESETPDSDLERRMTAVEGKLDRIIEQLGAKGAK